MLCYNCFDNEWFYEFLLICKTITNMSVCGVKDQMIFYIDVIC